MIGVFAKMFGPNDRVTEITPTEKGYEVGAKGPGDLEKKAEVREGPPEAFVEKVSYDGGDLYVIPFMEALRGWLKRKRDIGEEAARAEVEADAPPKRDAAEAPPPGFG